MSGLLTTPTFREAAFTPQFPNVFIRPPNNVPGNAFAFSSRVPFSRTDSAAGVTNAFYVKSGVLFGDGTEAPLFAGEASVRAVTPAAGSFPYVAGLDTQTGVYNFSARGSAPLGPDFLSLLDACATDTPLVVDVFNIRPIDTTVNTTLLGPSMQRIMANMQANRAALCATGSAPPQGAPITQQPREVLFSTPLRCPAVLKLFGQMRALSPLANKSSPLRLSLDEVFRAFPQGTGGPPTTAAQRALYDFFNTGDLSERAEVLRDLMILNPAFAPRPADHYAACAPTTCSYQSLRAPALGDILLNAVATYGGTASAVVTGLSTIALLISILAHECAAGRRERAAQQTSDAAIELSSPLPAAAVKGERIAAWGEESPRG